jgi:hypothetical protein
MDITHHNCNNTILSVPVKAIKIAPENRAAIESALETVNGRAWRHCFDRYSEIEEVVKAAEQWLNDRLPKSMWKGAQYEKQSGQTLAKAYKNSARTTTIRIERRASGWFLTQVKPSVLWPDRRPVEQVYLTQAQSADILRRVRVQYDLAQEASPTAKAA